MSPDRPHGGSGAPSPRERLAELRGAFLALADRVREQVAAIVAGAVADLVSRAVGAWLGRTGDMRQPATAHPGRPLADPAEDDPDEQCEWQVGNDDPAPEPEPPPTPWPARLAGAALAGWQAARLWASGRGPAWAVLAVGAVAGLGALLWPPLTAVAPALAAVVLADSLAAASRFSPRAQP